MFMLNVPQAIISLVILTFGNRFGDMITAYIYTREGGYESTVTATIAGPIFNILIGQFVFNLIKILNNKEAGILVSYVNFSLNNQNGEFKSSSLI